MTYHFGHRQELIRILLTTFGPVKLNQVANRGLHH